MEAASGSASVSTTSRGSTGDATASTTVAAPDVNVHAEGSRSCGGTVSSNATLTFVRSRLATAWKIADGVVSNATNT